MDIIRQGGSPFDLYGIRHLERQVSTMLAAILQLCHQVGRGGGGAVVVSCA